MASQNLVTFRSGNGLLPDSTKPLHEPMMTGQLGPQKQISMKFVVRYKTYLQEIAFENVDHLVPASLC